MAEEKEFTQEIGASFTKELQETLEAVDISDQNVRLATALTWMLGVSGMKCLMALKAIEELEVTDTIRRVARDSYARIDMAITNVSAIIDGVSLGLITATNAMATSLQEQGLEDLEELDIEPPGEGESIH